MAKILQLTPLKGELFNPVNGAMPVNTNVTIAMTEKGRALRFTGSEYLTYALPYNQSIFTIEIWIRYRSATSQFILDNRDGTNDGILMNVAVTTGVIRMSYNAATASGARNLADNQWHHVVFTADGSDLLIYTDNVADGTGANISAQGSIDVSTPLRIGARSFTSPAGYFTGDIGRIQYWNTVFSAGARAALYAEFLAAKPIQVAVKQQKALKESVIAADPVIIETGTNWNATTRTISSGSDLGAWRVASGSFMAAEHGLKNAANETLGSELITNGDMELDSSWTSYGTPATNERSNEQAHGGTYSRKIVTDGSEAEGIRQNLTNTKGRTYKYSCWIYRSAGTGTVSIYLDQLLGTVAVSDAWTEVSGYFTNITGGATIYFYTSAGTTATFYVDDVTVKEVTAPRVKEAVCISAGTLQLRGIDLSALTGNGYIKELSGDLSSDQDKTISAASKVAWANNVVTLTMTAGQTLRNFVVTRGS